MRRRGLLLLVQSVAHYSIDALTKREGAGGEEDDVLFARQGAIA